jgi:hypothetical protein
MKRVGGQLEGGARDAKLQAGGQRPEGLSDLQRLSRVSSFCARDGRHHALYN